MAIGAEVRFSSGDELRCYLSGAARDATHSALHRTIRFSQKGTEWLEVLRLALIELDKKSWMYREGTREVYTLETTWRDLRCPSTEGERRAFVRGYFDAEGGIPRDPAARFYVQFVQKDLDDLRSVRDCLEQLGISCGTLHNPSVSVDPDYWRFFVRSASHHRFCDTISTWHPRKRPILSARLRAWSSAEVVRAL